MTTGRWPLLVFAALALLAAAASLACGGKKAPEGAISPEEAVQQWLTDVTKGDSKAALKVTDPDFRELGVEGLSGADVLQTAAVYGKKASFSNLSFKTLYEPSRDFASVHVFGRVTIDGIDTAVDDSVVYTELHDRWFVTSEDSAYWQSALAKAVQIPDYVAAEEDADPSLPGVYVKPHPGPDGIFNTDDDRVHAPDGTVIPICTADQIARDAISNPVCYNSNPPTSGPHVPTFPNLRFYTTALPKEQLVHSMEHGTVVIWYNTTDQSVIDSLHTLTDGANGSKYLVIASPYDGMEPETIALTAWTRLDKFPVSDYTQDRVLTFIKAHSRRFNPEGF